MMKIIFMVATASVLTLIEDVALHLTPPFCIGE